MASSQMVWLVEARAFIQAAEHLVNQGHQDQVLFCSQFDWQGQSHGRTHLLARQVRTASDRRNEAIGGQVGGCAGQRRVVR